MQAKEELLEQMGETYGYVSQLVEKKVDLVKLNVAESSAKAISGIVTAVVLAVIGLITFVFALITLGFALTEALDSGVYGFGIVTLILLLIFVLIVALRRALITNPVVAAVITKFFAHDGKEV